MARENHVGQGMSLVPCDNLFRSIRADRLDPLAIAAVSPMSYAKNADCYSRRH